MTRDELVAAAEVVTDRRLLDLLATAASAREVVAAAEKHVALGGSIPEPLHSALRDLSSKTRDVMPWINAATDLEGEL